MSNANPDIQKPNTGGVVTRYADAWLRGDIATIINCYSENIVAHYGGQSAFAGDHVGRDRFLEVLLETSSRGRRTLVSIDQIHDDIDTGAFFVTESFVLDGVDVQVLRALRFRASNDTIVECWLFDQNQHLVEQAWAQPLP